MKKFQLLFCFCFFLVPFLGTHAAIATVSFQDALQASFRRGEDLANQMELVNQAEERYKQAVGSVLPSVNFVGSYMKQEAATAGTANAFFPTAQKTYKLTASQPLFQGFREYAALKQQSILKDAAKNSRDQAYFQLFQDTASSYYQVLMAEKDAADIQDEIDVNSKRLKDLRDFRKIGRSRESDVLTVESNIAVLKSQLEAAKVAIGTSRAIFAFMTGMESTAVLQDQETFPSKIGTVDEWVKKVEQRPDILAAKQVVEAQEKGVDIATGAHLPALGLGANYYFERAGALKDVNWDVTLTLTLPIFQGGVTQSLVRTSASQLSQAEIALSKARRLADQQVRVLHQQVLGDLAQVKQQKQTVQITEKAYQAQLRDYRHGLVNNLEVLTTLTVAQESQRQLDRLSYQYRIDYLKLLATVADRSCLKGVVK